VTWSTGKVVNVNKVFFRQLKASAAVGILSWEKVSRQEIWIDLEITVDMGKAAENDAIEFAVDYGQVRQCIIRFLQDSRFGLLEALAEKMATLLFNEFAISWLSLRVSKPEIFGDVAEVGVCIEREKSS
jgi:dihydroneopterin aldolase